MRLCTLLQDFFHGLLPLGLGVKRVVHMQSQVTILDRHENWNGFVPAL